MPLCCVVLRGAVQCCAVHASTLPGNDSCPPAQPLPPRLLAANLPPSLLLFPPIAWLTSIALHCRYQTALGMYELELAYMVVAHSQASPD